MASWLPWETERQRETKIKGGPTRFPLGTGAEAAPSGGGGRRRVRLEGPLITANERGSGVGEGSRGRAAGKIKSLVENFCSQAPPARGSGAVPAASLHTLTASKQGAEPPVSKRRANEVVPSSCILSFGQQETPKVVARLPGQSGSHPTRCNVVEYFSTHSRSNHSSQFPGPAHTSKYGIFHLQTDWKPQTAAPTAKLISIQD